MNSSRQSKRVPLEVLEDIVRRIVDVAEPREIILFGSAARGEMGPNSDIDLLVVTQSDRVHQGKLTEEIYRALRGVGHSVDVVVATPDDIDRYRESIGLVYEPALRDGEIVYRRPGRAGRCARRID